MSPNENKIRGTINTYVEGYLNADKNLISKAFSAETRLYSVDERNLDKTEMTDWLTNLDTRKAKGDIRQAKLEIKNIDITDDSAVAKIELHFAKMLFTDYLSLLQVNDVWTIVGKIYSVKMLE